MLAQNIHFLTNIIHADKQHQDAVIDLFDCTSAVVLELWALFVQLLQRDFRFVDRADIKYCLVVGNSIVIRVERADDCVGSAAKPSGFFALFLFITVIAVVMRVVVSEVGLKKAGVVGRFVWVGRVLPPELIIGREDGPRESTFILEVPDSRLVSSLWSTTTAPEHLVLLFDRNYI